MTTDTLGIYVHIPFCLKKCAYCDFCSFPDISPAARRAYLYALCREMEAYRDIQIPVDTVFMGGGTPSLLTPDEFDFVNNTLHNVFRIEPDAEYTMEVNPKTLTKEKVRAYLRGGVNRMNIGMQSANDGECRALGRIHTYEDFLLCWQLCREEGVPRLGTDIMYAIPTQTPASFRETLRRVCDLCAQHISAYSLIVEDGTPFGERRDTLILPGEDEEMRMYEDLCTAMRFAGYRHYEISNYARPGEQCRHNLRYWQQQEYLGFGVAAHSFFRGERFANDRDFPAYVRAEHRQSRQLLTKDEEAYEMVMLALRLADGLDLRAYERRFSTPFLTGDRRATADRCVRGGLATLTSERFCLTERGFYVSNAILTELL